jgi:hypothetical protein
MCKICKSNTKNTFKLFPTFLGGYKSRPEQVLAVGISILVKKGHAT